MIWFLGTFALIMWKHVSAIISFRILPSVSLRSLLNWIIGKKSRALLLSAMLCSSDESVIHSFITYKSDLLQSGFKSWSAAFSGFIMSIQTKIIKYQCRATLALAWWSIELIWSVLFRKPKFHLPSILSYVIL